MKSSVSTNEISNLSNIDRDAGDQERVPFDLSSAIYDVVEALATIAAAEDIELLVRYQSWVPSHPTGDVQHVVGVDREALIGAAVPALYRAAPVDCRVGIDWAGLRGAAKRRMSWRARIGHGVTVDWRGRGEYRGRPYRGSR